jgi:hypothetical protein
LRKFHSLRKLSIECDTWNQQDKSALKNALPGVAVNVEERLELPNAG